MAKFSDLPAGWSGEAPAQKKRKTVDLSATKVVEQSKQKQPNCFVENPKSNQLRDFADLPKMIKNGFGCGVEFDKLNLVKYHLLVNQNN